MASCTTYPVVAVVERSGERFYGTATSTLGESSFTLSNAAGVECIGTYKAAVVLDYSTGSTSRGRMTCSDGRKGTWVATGTAVGGQGEGLIGNQKVRVYYGQFASNQQIR